jgi:hypothetical protein
MNTTPNVTKPWEDWTEDRSVISDLSRLRVEIDDGRLLLLGQDPSTGEDTPKEFKIGYLSGETAFTAIGSALRFPGGCIKKLSTQDLRMAVLNDRVPERSALCQFFTDPTSEEVKSIIPGRRLPMPVKEVAEKFFEAAVEVFGAEGVKVDAKKNGKAHVHILTALREPVTESDGDSLQFGVDLLESPGRERLIWLTTDRHLCTNRARAATSKGFGWSGNVANTKSAQEDWIKDQVTLARQKISSHVERCRQMAATVIHGNMQEALEERAKAMRIPKRFWADIWEAYGEEPGNTEWAMFNAITRFATHHASLEQRMSFQAGAGSWADEYDVVTARMPRGIVQRAGGEIIREDELLEV